MTFSNQTVLDFWNGYVIAISNSSDGRFIGNYSTSAIDYAVFDVKRIGLLSNATFQFTATNKHVWGYDFPLPAATNVWESRQIPMSYSTNWKSSSTTYVFNVDRTCVTNIRIKVTGDGGSVPVQRLQIDNLKFVGPWEKGPLWADGVPKYWLVEYGLPNQEGMATNDWDNDGFNNYGEYLAGTDPTNQNSIFKVAIEGSPSNSVAVKWPRADYRLYKIFRSTNLTVAGSFGEYTGVTYQTFGQTNQATIGCQSNETRFFKIWVDKQ